MLKSYKPGQDIFIFLVVPLGKGLKSGLDILPRGFFKSIKKILILPQNRYFSTVPFGGVNFSVPLENITENMSARVADIRFDRREVYLARIMSQSEYDVWLKNNNKEKGVFMKINFRLIGKLGFLLVIVGYFMPVSHYFNGFEIAEFLVLDKSDVIFGLLMYLLIISAFFGSVIGILLLLKKNVKPTFDWAVIITCIVSGLIGFLGLIVRTFMDLEYGGYIILIGWIVALMSQIISKAKKET